MPSLTLFHVSRTEMPLESFHSFSHFGTAKAALDRGRASLVQRSEHAWFHEVDLEVGKSWKVPDLMSRSHTPILLADLLYYDCRPRRITSDERDAVLGAVAANPDFGHEAGYQALGEVLRSYGVDALSYRNLHEDSGSTSWIAMEPARMFVRRAVPMGDLLSECEAQGPLPGGMTSDADGEVARRIMAAMDVLVAWQDRDLNAFSR